MPFIDAAGVQVNFPFEPYPCQLTYMEKVVTCIREGENGILESPTGTGKTLCLLCASLAWLEDKRAQISSHRWKLANTESGPDGALATFKEGLANQLENSAGTWSGELVVRRSEYSVTDIGLSLSVCDKHAPPKIIYASRTHSQLTQAIQELKRTAYRHFKVCVLGSREQLCIHPQIMKEESNTIKVHLCRAKVQNRSCHFHNQLEAGKGNFMNEVLDIEDLVNLGQKHNCCPYYAARELKAEADIIFMPYNYLLDVKSRRAHGVELQGNIVIFDEAHNLEKICEESASFDLRSADIAAAMRELSELSEKVLDWVKEEESNTDQIHDSQIAIGQDFDLKELLQLKAMLSDLEEQLDAIPLPRPTEGATKPGSFIFEIFSKVNLTFSTKTVVLETVEKIVQHITNEAQSGIFNSRGAGLSKFADIIKIVFSREMEEFSAVSHHQKMVSKHYKVHIGQDESKKNKKSDGWGSVASSAKPGRTLSYWCFSPGHAMEELRDHGVKSIILTSGTLSPLSSFKSEMGIKFSVELENPHVIEKQQVWIGTVGKGPDGTLLNSSYEHRFKESYQSSLGNAIVNFARVVPKGMLLFFPSYTIMDKCLQLWQSTNIWSRIEQYKPIFVEPRHKAEFHTAMLNFYEKINDETLNGAIFAAVCRGKVSEGLDFSDNNGRAVIVTGLPYPPRMDPKVMLKMQFLDEMRRQGGQGLTGQEWYRQQATRAVNQAIGRVIRHRHDYGAIILCDNRFGTPTSRQQLPVWVRSQAVVYDAFGKAVREVMMFFKHAEKTMPVSCASKMRAAVPAARGSSGAYFQPTITRTSTKLLEKASTVVNHVPSISQKPVMSSELSLAKMRVQYEQTCPVSSSASTTNKWGLLEALCHSETPGQSTEETQKGPQMHSNQTGSKQTKNQAMVKKKIVLKKTPSQPDVFKDRLQSAEAYIAEVKGTLSSDSYSYFTTTLAEYRKTGNFPLLVSCLADIFTLNKGSHHLFRRFYRFVRPHHKEQFDRTCCEIIGQGCGFKPEDAVLKKRPAPGAVVGQEKKARLDEGKDTKLTSKDTGANTKTSSVSPSSKHLDARSHLNQGQGHTLGRPQNKDSLSLGGILSDNSNSVSTSVAGSISAATNSKTKHGIGSCKDIENTGDSVERHGGKDRRTPSSASEHLIEESAGSSKTTDVIDALSPSGGQEEHVDPAEVEASRTVNQLGGTLRERASQLLSRANQGYACCHCHQTALVPLKGPCGHVCCMDCWKETIRLTKSCPDCGNKVKRKDLARLFFASGPNLSRK